MHFRRINHKEAMTLNVNVNVNVTIMAWKGKS